MTAAALLGIVALTGAGLPPAIRWLAAGAAAALVHPVAAVLAALAVAARSQWGRFVPLPDGGALLLADQLALGLRAGLTLDGSLRAARPDLPEALSSEVGGVLRRARSKGMASALAAARGTGDRVYRISERAVLTGAPLAGAVEALADELRHEEHARRVADARRLPVRMLLPLALLILPGFVLALIGPALAGSLARLDIGW